MRDGALGLPRSAAWILIVALSGCATTPYIGQGPNPQIRRGRPQPLVDGLGNILGLPAKIVLWSWRVDDHAVSAQTESVLAHYLSDTSRPAAFADALFRLNEYTPGGELRRLAANRYVAWPYRLLLGLPMTLVFEILLPGRLIGGDHYNPWTNTVHLYSDDAAVALHEAGHAHDFAGQRYKGSYALLRLLPGMDLYQEYVASSAAIDYFALSRDRAAELHAYKILYPAYGTYLGSYLLPFGNYAGALVGHVWGRAKAHARAKYYALLDAAAVQAAQQPP